MAFKGWKKVSDAKDHAILRHDTGHEMKVAKSGLSPKMRGQLAEIPVHKEDNRKDSRAVADNKGQIKMSTGGKVSGAIQKQSIVDAYNGKPEPEAAPKGNTHDSRPTKLSPTAYKGETAAPAQPERDPDAEEAKASAESTPVDFRKKMADGGVADPALEAAGIPQDASNPNQFDFEQRKAAIAQSDMNYPSPQAADVGVTTKALDQLDNEKAAGAKAAASVGADQGAAYQQAVDLNKRLEAQGLPPKPLPPMPAGGTPSPAQETLQDAPSAGGMAPQAPGSDDPYGTGATQYAYTKGIGEQKAGIFGEARALGAQGNAEAKLAHDAAVNKQNLMDSYQNENGALNAKREEFMQHLSEQKIDPNHYLGDMSTMGRIGNAIGLLMGGVGAGLTGGKNPALEMLNANIDRDIRAQEANLGTSKSLLEFNQQQFGNLRDAKEMTRSMMNDTVSMKLKEAAAKAQDPLAKARALQAAGQLDQQTAANVGQYAMRKTMLSGVKDGKVAPASFIEFGITNPGERTAARKELAEAQEAVKSRDNLLGAFDRVAKLQTLGSRLGSPVQSTSEIHALQKPLIAQMSKATAGRFTEADAGYLETLWPTLKDDPTRVLAKRAQMQRIINEKMNYPTLDAYHINPVKSGGRFNEQGQSKYKEMAPVQNKKR